MRDWCVSSRCMIQQCLACRSHSFTGLSAHSAVASGACRIARQKFASSPSRSFTVSVLASCGRAKRMAPDPKNGST